MERVNIRQKHRKFIHRQNVEDLNTRKNIENLYTEKRGAFKHKTKTQRIYKQTKHAAFKHKTKTQRI